MESLEVITNPSAEFSPDGTGGVINIVTKKVTKAGKTGSVQAAIGSNGRGNLSALGARNAGKLNITGSLGAREQKNHPAANGQTTFIGLGQRTDSISENAGQTHYVSYNGAGNVDYDITKADRLTASVSVYKNLSDATNLASEVRTDANAVVQRDYDILYDASGDGISGQLAAGWRHSFAQAGRVLNVTTRRGYNRSTNLSQLIFIDRTPVGGRTDQRRTENRYAGQSLSATYVHPLAANASLRMGYDYQRSLTDQDFIGLRLDPILGPVNLPDYSNRFVFVDTNHQAYATYQRPFGKLTVLAGLRLELAQVEYDQRTTAITGDNEYTDAHPSLHLQYALNESQNLTLSYSHRVQRPGSSQRNPFLVISNEFSATSGNPDLRPQETHSLEAGWRWQKGARTAGATAYYRQNYNTIGSVNRFLTPIIVLNTFENQGTSTSAGWNWTRAGDGANA